MTLLKNLTSNLTSSLTSNLTDDVFLQNPHTSGRVIQMATFQEGLTKNQLVTVDEIEKTSALLDYSGANDSLIQNITIGQPVFTENIINGHPILRFDGANEFIAGSVAKTIQTIFIVGILRAGHPVLTGLFNEKNADSNNLRAISAVFRGNNNTDANDFTHENGIMRIDGVVTDTVVVDTPFILFAEAVNSVSIIPQISQDLNSRYWKGDVGEFICYNDVLVTGERQSVLQYLSTKWGIALA